MTASKSDRIAICGEQVPISIKQHLLFFDRIGVFHLKRAIAALHLWTFAEDVGLSSDQCIALSNDLEFLQSKKLVFEQESASCSFDVEPGPKGKDSSKEDEEDRISTDLIMNAMFTRAQGKNRSGTPVDLVEAYQLICARNSARNMQSATGLEVSAVRSRRLIVPEELRQLEAFQRPTTDVIDIVLDKIPMPSELTPWEAILDFKADTDAQGYLQGLKVWMSEIARQKLTAAEASEKLDWLLFQQKKHLEMHKLSYRWGTFGGTFVAAAEIMEDIAKIKWGKAAGAVVSIFDRRLELMKAELDNPAKEVSYIVKAQEQFGE
jgi:hypothetical protein